MSDDQDGCERVNVSSGTGIPGLSRTKGRQTVVCVCVCVYLLLQQYELVCSLHLANQNFLAQPSVTAKFGRHAFSYSIACHQYGTIYPYPFDLLKPLPHSDLISQCVTLSCHLAITRASDWSLAALLDNLARMFY